MNLFLILLLLSALFISNCHCVGERKNSSKGNNKIWRVKLSGMAEQSSQTGAESATKNEGQETTSESSSYGGRKAIPNLSEIMSEESKKAKYEKAEKEKAPPPYLHAALKSPSSGSKKASLLAPSSEVAQQSQHSDIAVEIGSLKINESMPENRKGPMERIGHKEKGKGKQKAVIEAAAKEDMQNKVSVDHVGEDKIQLELIRPNNMEMRNPFLVLKNLPTVKIVPEGQEGEVVISHPRMDAENKGRQQERGEGGGGRGGRKKKGDKGRAKGGLSSSLTSSLPTATQQAQVEEEKEGGAIEEMIGISEKMLLRLQPKIDKLATILEKIFANANKLMHQDEPDQREGMSAILQQASIHLDEFWLANLKEIVPNGGKFDQMKIYRYVVALRQCAIDNHFASQNANDKMTKIYGQNCICFQTYAMHSFRLLSNVANEFEKELVEFKKVQGNPLERSTFFKPLREVFDKKIVPNFADYFDIHYNLGRDGKEREKIIDDIMRNGTPKEQKEYFAQFGKFFALCLPPMKQGEVARVNGIFADYFDTKLELAEAIIRQLGMQIPK